MDQLRPRLFDGSHLDFPGMNQNIALRPHQADAVWRGMSAAIPAVLTLAEADAELQRLALLKKNHLDEQYVARRSVRDLPGTIARLSERLASHTADQATTAAHAGDLITIGSRTCSREDAPAVLASQLESLPRHVREVRRNGVALLQ